MILLVSPGPASDSTVKEEVIDAVFQEGLREPGSKLPPHQTHNGKSAHDVIISGVESLDDARAMHETKRTKEVNNGEHCHL